jgi:hypothetical protein
VDVSVVENVEVPLCKAVDEAVDDAELLAVLLAEDVSVDDGEVISQP